MKELLTIVEVFEQVQRGETAALATVVEVRGSTYRGVGARMLITQSGQRVGTISGGCLESDVCEWAQQVISSGKPMVVKYDTTSGEDAVWGLGLGCNGLVSILIERLDQRTRLSHLGFVAECLRHRHSGVLVTVFSVEGEMPSRIGDRLILSPDKIVTSDIAEPILTEAVIADAQVAFAKGRSTVKTYPLPTGSVTVFIEVIQPPTSLLIFGSGHDAIPVAEFAKALGWHVTLVDSRATPEGFPMADKLILSRPEAAHKQIGIDDRTVAVVMTHNYLHDLELLKTLLPSPLRYLGILGPKSRTERLLREAEMMPTNEQLQRLYGPVGLDIGADTPEAIALAIIAEIQAVLANRSGGLLRDRKGAIHS